MVMHQCNVIILRIMLQMRFALGFFAIALLALCVPASCAVPVCDTPPLRDEMVAYEPTREYNVSGVVSRRGFYSMVDENRFKYVLALCIGVWREC